MTVQQSFPRPRATTNPYLRLLGDAVARQPGVRVRVFSWRSALLSRYDVFHVHWPEILVTGRTPLRGLARQLLTSVLILRLTVLGIPVVRTLHNTAAHEGLGLRQRLLVRLLERRTKLVIRLNDCTEVDASIAVETIPHGHYRDWYLPVDDAPTRERGHFAFVGLIRPYKGVERLVQAFRELPGDVTFTAAGKPSSQELRDELVDLAAGDDRIDLELRFLGEDDLISTVRRAELVVLPHREMHNSGSALTALSLDRPVLVPRNDVNDRLSDEVGSAWVQEFDGELTADDLERALASVRLLDDGDRPDLSAREWVDAGSRHVAAYRRALVLARGHHRLEGDRV